ncbi:MULTISPECIES: MarR family winged helix-turn-helix transcriptional regulator [Thermomonosporaceae]|uniref:MarR family winged helix-turn-helix transcriptional regulator n=1 Tax=Thermomonosporaceae TaxID=2012 RepID=UPI00255B0DEA|nr:MULTISPECIES: MarR family transcriptional regulator [Thermomonosporaceae]MDL4771323.1 MarR family transcriptional regulator [Actinomadura xylanilytica]
MTASPPDATADPAPARGGPPDADAAGRAWRNLRILMHERGDRRREVTEALGLSFFRVKALRRIAAGPTTLGELAEGLLTDRPYTTLVVEDLVKRGLAERAPNPGDRRSKIVSVTAAGRAAADEAERILDTPLPALHDLPGGDLAALDRIAARLVASS